MSLKSDGTEGCIGAVLIAVILAALFGGCRACSTVEMSDGTRDSTVRKVSNSGVIWRTNEVETLGDGFRMADGRATPETFKYTVRNPEVLAKLQALPSDKKVRIHYKKYLTAWVPNGESQYEIIGVDDLK